ncbi:uncharacterized protein LOC143617418 [Bidens hawaiensis]|uniref:uncharacterized protein LOC143617418 n=1 Tax=Bidens hawaiensis TaxID=980011 RepID=UPI004048F432
MKSASDKAVVIKSSASKRKRQTSSDQSGDDSDYKPLEESRGAANRVWSKVDEIKLLECLKKQEKKDDMGKLLETVTNSLSFNPTRRQLADKVRKLKSKFTKGKTAPRSTDDHIFTLSQQLWGVEGNEVDNKIEDENEDAEDGLEELDEVYAFLKKYQYMDRCITDMYSRLNLGVDGCRMVKSNIKSSLMTGISSKELGEMEQAWTKHYDEELLLVYKRLKLMKKQWKLHQRVHSGIKLMEKK